LDSRFALHSLLVVNSLRIPWVYKRPEGGHEVAFIDPLVVSQLRNSASVEDLDFRLVYQGTQQAPAITLPPAPYLAPADQPVPEDTPAAQDIAP